jgi:hypothetical protein
VRSCTHPDARSIRAPIGAPPAPYGAGNGKKEATKKKKEKEGGANEEKRSGQ